MKEVKKFKLLRKLRKESKVGLDFLEKVCNESKENDVFISDLCFRNNELKTCAEILKKAKKAKTIKEISRYLKEDTIPIGLLYKEEFWKEFQDSINLLYCK